MNKKWIVVLLAIGILGVLVFFVGKWGQVSAPVALHAKEGDRSDKRGARNNSKSGLAGRVLTVQAAFVKRGDMVVTLDVLGTVNALNTVIVKPRVNGQIVRVAFREGQVVREGDTLVELDARSFQAAYDQAMGQFLRDEALLANARADLDRYQGLLKQDSISSQQVDNQGWLVRQYEGALKNDRGLLEAAKLQLSFARVSAPISGRVGLRQVDVGNYVQTSDANGIVLLTQTQPISVVFSIPAAKFAPIVTRLRAGKHLPIEVFDRDSKTLLATGQVSSADNQMDISTGTVKIKGTFLNRD